jgi:hypothetical protein
MSQMTQDDPQMTQMTQMTQMRKKNTMEIQPEPDVLPPSWPAQDIILLVNLIFFLICVICVICG